MSGANVLVSGPGAQPKRTSWQFGGTLKALGPKVRLPSVEVRPYAAEGAAVFGQTAVRHAHT